MSNNKQSSVEWYSVKRDVLEIEVRLGKLSANEYAEELAKAEQQAKAMHKEEKDQSYRDGFEFALINECAKQSTSDASQYAEGYSEGYKRALDYMADTIKNKIEIKGNGTNIFTTTGTTTSTTAFLCAQFVGEGRTTTSNPRCIKCGKEIWQHPIISHTI